MSSRYIEIESQNDALKYFAGMALIQKAYLSDHDKKGQYYVTWGTRSDRNIGEYADFLAVEIQQKLKDDGRKVKSTISSDYIKKCCSKAMKKIEMERAEFQRGRLQFNVRLNKMQRNKLLSARLVSLDELHQDDFERAKKKINDHIESGRNATIRANKNGGYFIVW